MTTSITTPLVPLTTPAAKPIWQSKTFWLNVLTIALAILTITEPEMLHIDPKMLLWITGVLNILLRFLTNGPVSMMGNGGTATREVTEENLYAMKIPIPRQ